MKQIFCKASNCRICSCVHGIYGGCIVGLSHGVETRFAFVRRITHWTRIIYARNAQVKSLIKHSFRHALLRYWCENPCYHFPTLTARLNRCSGVWTNGLIGVSAKLPYWLEG